MKKLYSVRKNSKLISAFLLIAAILSGLVNIVPAESKNVIAASSLSEKQVILCGTPFGIRLFTSGVVVVGTADIQTNEGTVNPPAKSGVQVGDIVTGVNGKGVNSNEEVSEAIRKSGGQVVQLSLLREGKAFTAALQPVASPAGYRAGLWVRDSTAGIGTLTFYDPDTKIFAGLGHGICDPDTNELMPLLSGDVVPVTISGIRKGVQGTAGELQGYFASDTAIGTLSQNGTCGVFGSLRENPQGETISVMSADEVHAGPVKILSTIDQNGPKAYDACIEFVNCRGGNSKNIVLKITDSKLLEKTGGIVQGMSGSPILQDGKLAGAVTHVFVNDPTRGYGILAVNMISADSQSQETLAGSLLPAVRIL